MDLVAAGVHCPHHHPAAYSDVPLRLPNGRSLLISLMVGGLVSHPCHASPDSLYHEVRPAMGTTVEIYLYAAGSVRDVRPSFSKQPSRRSSVSKRH
jgi:hypothetical protein